MSSADHTKFYVFDRNSKEEIAILLVKAGCRGYWLYDAIGNLQTTVSKLSLGSYRVLRSLMEKVVEEITAIEMRL